MSGGHFNVYSMEDIENELKEIINNTEEYNYSDATKEILEETKKIAMDLYARMYHIDRLVSGDHSEKTFLQLFNHWKKN